MFQCREGMQPSGARARGAEFQCALPQHITEKFANCHWCWLALPRECICERVECENRTRSVGLCVKSRHFQRGRRAFFYYSLGVSELLRCFKEVYFFLYSRADNTIGDHLVGRSQMAAERCCQAKQSNVAFYYITFTSDWLMNIQSWSHCQIPPTYLLFN